MKSSLRVAASKRNVPIYRRLRDSVCCGCVHTREKQQRLRRATERSGPLHTLHADRDWDEPLSLGQGWLEANTAARSICGGLRAFLRSQVWSRLAPASLIIPSQGVREACTILWTLDACGTATRLLCVQAMQRFCRQTLRRRRQRCATVLLAVVCERRAEQWRLRIKPRRDICANLC